MRHGPHAKHLTFCAVCRSVRRFRGVCSCETVEPYRRPRVPCALLERSSVCLHFGSKLYSPLPSPFLSLFRGTCVCLRLSSSSRLVDHSRKHEFVPLKFWDSIKIGHILGSFYPKAGKRSNRPSSRLGVIYRVTIYLWIRMICDARSAPMAKFARGAI